MLNRFSVAITYPLLLLGLVLGVALLFGALGVTGTERTSMDLVDRLTDQSTARMRLAIIRNLEGPHHLADLNARLIQSGTFDPSDVRTFIPEFLAQLQSFSDVGAILVCNKNLDTMWVERMSETSAKVALFESGKNEGKCVEWLLDDVGKIVGDPLGAYPYEPPQRPWYKSAFAGKDERGWSELYSWATTENTHPIGTGRSMVVRDSKGAFLAIIDVGFTVEELSDYLDGIEVSPNGRVFIMDAMGQLVATDTKDAPASIDEKVVKAIDSNHPIVAHAAQILATEGHRSTDESGFTHASLTEHDGERYLINSSELGLDWGPTWFIVTAIPESDLLSGVRSVQRRLFLWGIVVLVIAAFGGLLLAFAIVRPIVGLRKSAKRISEGDLDVKFKGRGGREFAELATDLDSMCRGLKERLDLRNSLEVAMEVQQHLLPSEVPQSDTLEIAAFSKYCDETGGDYYDFPDFNVVGQVEDGSLFVTIGDVTGHGIAAALIMASARSALRTRLRQGGSLGSILQDVNEVLCVDTAGGRFMTLLVVIISADGSSFKWAGAGHDPPILFDPTTGAFMEPEGGGVPLGILPGTDFEEYSCPIGPPGSIFVTGTDGIWETADPDGVLFGKERLREIILKHQNDSPDDIGKAIIEKLNEYRQSDHPLDDVTLVVIKRRTP